MAQHHSTANDQAFEEADAIQGANYKTVSPSNVSLTHQQRAVTGAWDRTQTFDILIFPQISYLLLLILYLNLGKTALSVGN